MLTHLTALQMADGLAAGNFTSVELVQAHLDRIADIDGDAESGINAFLHVDAEGALATAAEVDAARAAGEKLHRLAGVPVAIKDMLVTIDQPTTAGSKMLEGWLSPYDATVVAKLREAKLPIIGKTNMDEFAMGSSTEFSAFGPTRNPWDQTRAPGGSGGGSAAAVAAYMVPLALGTDTGGSIREPAAYTGTVGVKPTYGAVSRYGCIGMASSLDTVGPATRTVADAAALQELIGGRDPKDATSMDVSGLAEAVEQKDLTGLKIGVQTTQDDVSEGVWTVFQQSLDALRAAGAEIVQLPRVDLAYALSAYYLLMPAEASSNLAKFDGVRFGNRVVPENPTTDSVMSATRAAGFGPEVKRRIILGTYVLSSGHYDAYYLRAQKVRTMVQNQYRELFDQVDALVEPMVPTTAIKLGVQMKDPTTMYTSEMVAISSNLAGVPAVSVPIGLSEELPVGLHIQAPAAADALNYRIAAAVENQLDEARGTEFHALLGGRQ